MSTDSFPHSGMRSGKITSNETGNSFGSIAYKIPANYEGKTIKLEGFMKIENVENGYAGLLLRVDGNGSSLAFDNMQNQKITGTRDWQKYSITLDYPKGAESIYIAGILAGKGKAWFDDFTLTIDGKNIQTLKEIKGLGKYLSKAEKDREFDNGSLIKLSNLTSENIDNLELLGRIWGFLKYYHPAITQGKYNWDYEMFRFLPKYSKAQSANDRDELIMDWITAFGKIKECLKCQPMDTNAYIKPDLAWIDHQSGALKNKLLQVYNSRSQGESYYIGMVPNIGNPEFKN